jgi:penicillin-binding protein A
MNTDKIFVFLRRTYFFPVIFFLIPLVIYGFFSFQIRHSEELILSGEYPTALHNWKSFPLLSDRVYETIGTAELLSRGKDSAELYFRHTKTKPVHMWPAVLKKLWESARYEDGLFYTEHLRKQIHNENVLLFYNAGFLAGTNQLGLAKKELLAAGHIPEVAKEAAILKSEIEHRLSTGQFTFAFDRQNLPLVSKSLQGTPNILYDAVRTVFRNPSGDYLAGPENRPNAQITVTLDYRIQNAALKALEKYAGAIVLLDVQKGDILAAASSSKSPGTAVATHVMYEPGSIIKMITLAGALESRSNPEKLFPLQCDGALKLSDNQAFYCWKAHGQVKDANVATAVSCNVAFAKIGLAMKQADLLSNLRRFGFDAKLKGDYFPLQLGKTIEGEMNDRDVANLSIGLENLKITPLHSAMIAAAIANEGVCMAPRVLLNYRNVIGLPYSAAQPKVYATFMSKQTADVLSKAMEQVVLHPEGTGRRASVPGLPIAMKTGTAGEGATGYDAILIGFVPVKKPKVAFAIVAEHSGKAEFEGARITKLFLESIQGYIQ